MSRQKLGGFLYLLRSFCKFSGRFIVKNKNIQVARTITFFDIQSSITESEVKGTAFFDRVSVYSRVARHRKDSVYRCRMRIRRRGIRIFPGPAIAPCPFYVIRSRVLPRERDSPTPYVAL